MSVRWRPSDLDALRRRRSRSAATAGAGVDPSPAPAPRKYRNEPVHWNGERFDSRWELECWQQLLLRQRAGDIGQLRRQVRLPLHSNGLRIGHYVADFAYVTRDGLLHYADAKGGEATQTQLFRWKARHVQAEYGIAVEILERR